MKKILHAAAFLTAMALKAQIGFVPQEVTSFTMANEYQIGIDVDGDGNLDIVRYGDGVVDWYENKFPETGFRNGQRLASPPGDFSTSVSFADYDADGDLDILATDFLGDRLYLLPRTGLLEFGPPQLLKTIDQIRMVQYIDMDNDGDKDLFFAAYGTTLTQIGYYENTGQPNNYTILHAFTNANATSEYNLELADLDNDGLTDVFSRTTNSISWFKNTGTAFTQTFIPNGSNEYFDAAIANLDNDGDVDLVLHTIANDIIKLTFKLNDGSGSFAAEQIIRQNMPSRALIDIEDLDNDAKQDLVIAPYYLSETNTVDFLWYKNQGNMTFADMPAIDSGLYRTLEVQAFDFNNDGYKDILTSSMSDSAIYHNTGAADFQAPYFPISRVLAASSAAAGDVDGDGDPDVVASSAEEGKIFLYRRLADGSYANRVTITQWLTNLKELVLADIDADGHLDIVSISGTSDSGEEDKIVWLKNLDGLGNFGPQNDIVIGIYDSPDGLTVCDLDGDGDPDIVTSLTAWPENGDKIVWFANNGTGIFGGPQTIGTGVTSVQAVRHADIDNDGDLDIVCASSYDNKISWYANANGLGSFGPQQVIATDATSVRDVAIADFDSDGDQDVVYMSNAFSSASRGIFWQPNTNGLGTFGARIAINTNTAANASTSILAADIDNDADIDIIVGEYARLTWSENLYGQANFEPAKLISNDEMVASASSLMATDADNDGDLDILLASPVSHRVLWQKNQGQTQNTIKGVVRIDFEGNGCETGDATLPRLLVSTTDGSSTQATVTFGNEYSGQYRLYTGQGNFETRVESTVPTYYALSPAVHNSSFTGFGSIDTADFCIAPTGQFNDLVIRLYPLGEARPGFATSYRLVYGNIGTTVLSGQATLQYQAAKMQFQNATPVASSQSAGTLAFAFANLAPFESRSVIVRFQIFAPPATNFDDQLTFTAIISPADSDFTPQDNTHIFNETVIGAYDPNDIRCVEGDEVAIADANKYLHYVIRFQNTGNASAINVKVQHELDPKLDWTTFALEGMSHNGRTTITNGSLVEFMFNNIRLPHESLDPQGSNGHILFKIKPKENEIIVGDVVQAAANIFFDFNPPITTNTAATEYVDALRNHSFETETIALYPNPANDRLEIRSNEAVERVEIYNVLGSSVLTASGSVHSLAGLGSGIYLVHITTAKGTTVRKLIKS